MSRLKKSSERRQRSISLKKTTLAVGLSGLICSVSAQMVICQSVPNTVLADLIKRQHLTSAGQSVKAVLDNNQAIITCDRNPNDDDEACKRRAILIAKCVFDSQPNEIDKTKIQFLDLKNASVAIV